MKFVRRDKYLTRVSTVSEVGGDVVHGRETLQPGDILFGRAARQVQDGVYSDAGEFVSSHEQYVSSVAV